MPITVISLLNIFNFLKSVAVIWRRCEFVRPEWHWRQRLWDNKVLYGKRPWRNMQILLRWCFYRMCSNNGATCENFLQFSVWCLQLIIEVKQLKCGIEREIIIYTTYVKYLFISQQLQIRKFAKLWDHTGVNYFCATSMYRGGGYKIAVHTF